MNGQEKGYGTSYYSRADLKTNGIFIGKTLQKVESDNCSCKGCYYENTGCHKLELCDNKKFILIEEVKR